MKRYTMKTLILSLAIFSSFAMLAQAAQDSSAPNATGPALNNNTAPVFPWQAGAGINPGRLSRLLADLQDDIGTAIPRLAALDNNVDNGAQPVVDTGAPQ